MLARFAASTATFAALGMALSAPAHAWDATPTGPVGPEKYTFAGAYAHTLLVPNAVPTGVNDFSCKPSAAHPEPVVLIEGTFGTTYSSWAYYAPELKKLGYCVFAPELPKDTDSFWKDVKNANATGPVMDAARITGEFTQKVLDSTGAKKVDMIGWSQGGVVARGYTKFFGGANKVDQIITLGATNHGTTLLGIGKLADTIHPDLPVKVGSRASDDQLVGSDYITALNAGGDTLPGIDYTVIGTQYDEVTTPWRSTFLTAGPGATVKNIRLQDGCEIMGTDHTGLPFNQRGFAYAKKALDPTDRSPLPCYPVGPFLN